jgi:hypothetical protein
MTLMVIEIIHSSPLCKNLANVHGLIVRYEQIRNVNVVIHEDVD